MPTLRTFGYAANLFEPDLGLPDFSRALDAVARGSFTVVPPTVSPTFLQVQADPGHGLFSLTGTFDYSSEAALLSSRITGLSFFDSRYWGSASYGGFSITGLSLTLSQFATADLGSPTGSWSVRGSSFADILAGDRFNDTLLGGGGSNTLVGEAGNDLLDGQSVERDLLIGGPGNDTFVLGLAGADPATLSRDTVVEFPGEGIDLIRAAYSLDLPDNVENLELLGGGALEGRGNGLANRITGNAGANLLDGGGGNDTLAGGAGSDTYVVDASGDVVQETAAGASGGVDVVRAAVSFVLGANVEQLELTGAGAINGTGNALANRITGNGGANRLDGGAGSDTLAGGLGDDTYVLDGLGDVIEGEGAGGGRDAVVAGRSLVLGTAGTMLEFVEDAELLGTGAFTLTGTDGANVLRGNAGANTIRGGGGDDLLDGRGGADSMEGGAGADTYVVDSLQDRILDPDGDVEVWSTVTLDLGQASPAWHLQVRKVVLQGTANLGLTGNALANTLIGNGGTNVLSGSGGDDTLGGSAGADTLSGDAGNDQLDGGADGDMLFGGDGHDLLAGGAGDDSVTGEAGDDLLEGGEGADLLAGGAGSDTFRGGAGADTLVGGQGDDRYEDVESGDVVLELPDAGFDVVVVSTSLDLSRFLSIEAVELTGTTDLSVTGSVNAERVLGNSGSNRLDGLAGNDTLEGGGGDDTLLGGAGEDLLDGGAGADSMAGGPGNDTLSGGEGNDTLGGGAGVDRLTGGSGDDLLVFDFDSDTRLDGGSGTDTLAVSGAGVALVLNGLIGPGQVFDGIEIIDLAGTGNNTLGPVGASIVLDLSDDDQLLVKGDPGDAVTVVGADWTEGALQPIGAELYRSFTSATAEVATLLVAADLTLSLV